MARRDRNISTVFSPEGPFFAAILEVLDDMFDLLDARLPKPDGGHDESEGGVVQLREPATPSTPAEPPDPDPDPGPEADVQAEAEPMAADPADESPAPPPRAGRGSSLDAWRTFADRAGVTYPPDAGRDQLIAACEEAGVVDRT